MGEGKAAEAPRFLVKHDGKYYLAVGVLEYDPAAVKTEAERRGVEEVAKYFQPDASTAAAFSDEPEIEVRAFSSAVAFGQATNNFD